MAPMWIVQTRAPRRRDHGRRSSVAHVNEHLSVVDVAHVRREGGVDGGAFDLDLEGLEAGLLAGGDRALHVLLGHGGHEQLGARVVLVHDVVVHHDVVDVEVRQLALHLELVDLLALGERDREVAVGGAIIADDREVVGRDRCAFAASLSAVATPGTSPSNAAASSAENSPTWYAEILWRLALPSSTTSSKRRGPMRMPQERAMWERGRSAGEAGCAFGAASAER